MCNLSSQVIDESVSSTSGLLYMRKFKCWVRKTVDGTCTAGAHAICAGNFVRNDRCCSIFYLHYLQEWAQLGHWTNWLRGILLPWMQSIIVIRRLTLARAAGSDFAHALPNGSTLPVHRVLDVLSCSRPIQQCATNSTR